MLKSNTETNEIQYSSIYTCLPHWNWDQNASYHKMFPGLSVLLQIFFLAF